MSVEGADRKEENPPVEPSGLAGTLDRTFGLTAAGSSVPTELRAGLATFLTMAYIMFVNPAILEKAGMDHGAVFVATCLAAALSTAIMGLYANYPIALAPGMGLNAYFAFTMVPELGGNWQLALGVVFLSGALFLLISVTPIREWLINAIPLNLKLGIAAGIGLFLALIGLQNAGLVAADATTLVKLGDLTQAKALLAIAGFLIIAGLAARKVPGAIIFGVIAVTLAAVWLGLEPWHGLAAMPPSLAPTFLKMDLAGVFQLALLTMVLTLLLVMLLDTAGTLIGVARQAGFLDKDGRLPRLRQALLADFRRSDARRGARHFDHDRLYRERRGRGGGRPHGAYGARRRCAVSRQPVSGAARPDRAALRHGAGAPLRRLPDGHEPRRHPMGRANRIHPGAHHRADDSLELLHRHRDRARLHRLCCAEANVGSRT